MAIAHDATTADPGQGGGTTRTFSHTVAGSNRYLIVKIACGAVTVASVKYAGVDMTKIGVDKTQSGVKISFWGLVAPATGANNVVVTFASTTYKTCSASSYTGVDQTTPIGTEPAGTGATSNAPSITATSAAGEVVVDGVAWQMTAAPPTATMTAHAGRVSRHNVQGFDTTSSGRALAGSDTPGAASVVNDWTLSISNTPWAMKAIQLKPVSTALVLSATGFASGGAIGSDALSGAAIPTATYYVDDATGNDANAGTLAAPWKTIAKAIRTGISGSLVQVRGGFYSQLNLSADTINKTPTPITIQPYQDEEVVVTGAITGDLQYVNFTGIAFAGPCVWGNDATGKKMQNCVFTSCIFDGLNAIGANLVDVASAGGGTNCFWDYCWFRNARYNASTEGTGGKGLTFSGAVSSRPSNVRTRGCLFENIEGSGIVFEQGHTTWLNEDNIFDNVAYGATLPQARPVQVGVYDDSSGTTYRRNTQTGPNGRYLEMDIRAGTGPRVGYGTHLTAIIENNVWFEGTNDRLAYFVNCQGIRFVNNTGWNADSAAFGVEFQYKAGVTANSATTAAVLKNNILSRLDVKNIGGTVGFASRGYNLIQTYVLDGTPTTPGDPGEIQTLPTFQNIGGFNYRLTNASAGVNAGDTNTTYVPATDRGGDARIVGGRVDMGAYESGVSLSLSATGFASDGSFGTSGLIAGTAIPVIAAFGLASEEVIGNATLALAGGSPPPSTGPGLPPASKRPHGLSQPDVPAHAVSARRIKRA